MFAAASSTGTPLRICSACGVPKPADSYKPRCGRCPDCLRTYGTEYARLARQRENQRRWAANNKDRKRAQGRAWRDRNPEYQLLRGARKRAEAKGIPFDLSVEDISIPSHCPVLGMPLVFATGQPRDNSPTLDRVVPELGYVRGNVAVISFRANTIKLNGTADEHYRIAVWMRARGAT